MKTITIAENITLTATFATIAQVKRELREAEIEREQRAWLADPANRTSELHSDIYKDVHGVRPC